MGTVSLTQSFQANQPLPRSCRPVSTNVRAAKITAEIIRICRSAIGGNSFRKSMAKRARCSLGTIDNWIAGNRVVDVDRLLNVFDGPEGYECFNAFLGSVPEEIRERWISRTILERRLAEAEAEVRRVRGEVVDRQINMELNRR